MSGAIPYLVIFAITLLLTAFAVKELIPVFSRKAKQPIYEGGPSWHLSKSGTPTMGGIGFIIPTVLACLLFCMRLNVAGEKTRAISLFITVMFALLNGAIGILDDMTKIGHKENRGLRAYEKLFLQCACVVMLLAMRSAFVDPSTAVNFAGFKIELGFFYYPLCAFILLGVINCANLTDGIDGLASSVTLAAVIPMFYAAYMSASESAAICAALVGATVGFLIYNLHPAKIFMGDTGSLFLGALVASSSLSLGGPSAMLGFGAVYIIEGFSVVIQVIFFKLRKKRVFKMAPLHHHLEKSGWCEEKICIGAIIISLLSSVFTSFLILK